MSDEYKKLYIANCTYVYVVLSLCSIHCLVLYMVYVRSTGIH